MKNRLFVAAAALLLSLGTLPRLAPAEDQMPVPLVPVSGHTKYILTH